jgi:hypothetical protein
MSSFAQITTVPKSNVRKYENFKKKYHFLTENITFLPTIWGVLTSKRHTQWAYLIRFFFQFVQEQITSGSQPFGIGIPPNQKFSLKFDFCVPSTHCLRTPRGTGTPG